MNTTTLLRKLAFASVGVATLTVGTLHVKPAEALTLGPDAYGYSATDEIPFSFTDISGTGTRILAGADDASSTANVGFNFNFYGANYNTVSLSSNGLMSFGGSNSQFFNQNLTTDAPSGNLPSIAVLWDDWQYFQSGADAVYHQTVGAVGSRRFITQWNVAGGFASSPSFVTFQSVLFEGSNNILLSFLDTESGDFRNFGSNATVGIRDTNGQVNGRLLQWSHNSSGITNRSSVLFTTTPIPTPALLPGLIGMGVAALRKRKATAVEETNEA